LPEPASPFLAEKDGVAVAVRLTPKAARAGIGPVETDAAGKAVLRAAVTEPPERGRANRALIKLLSKAWKVPKSAIEIRRGAKDRTKALFVRGDPAALMARMTGGH